MMPLVTVIIPSFNHAQYIENAISSVLSQDYKNLELIVVDDGSTDETHAILSRVSVNDQLTIILNNVNQGQSAVLNQALQIAKGEYICLLPSDDWFLPCKISLQIEKFLQCDSEVGLIYGRGLRYFVDTKKTIPVDMPMYRGWVLEKLIKEPNFIYPITPMFKRECFEFARPDETYKAEGEAIYLKLAIKYKFDYVDEVVGVMRDHSYNTGKNISMMYSDNIRYWNEFFDRKDLTESVRKLRNIPLSRIHRLKGLESIMIEKDFSVGRSALLKSIGLMPSLVFDYRVIFGIVLSFLPHWLSDPLTSIKRTTRVDEHK